MIYLDNAATGGFKPRAVSDAANTVIRYLSANPGRSGHRLSVSGAEIVFNCRKLMAEFFGATPERVIFTKNCTEALNTAIFGTLKKGGHVITTVFEHNSVLRPLHFLKAQGLIELDIISPIQGVPLELAIKKAIKQNTYLVVTTAVSNVTGKTLPIDRIGKLCNSHKLLYLVDGAQAGGHISLDISKQKISMLCLAGHKGLMGVMGSGALIFNEQTEISPMIMGGTGSESFNLLQPECYPEKLESGTLNLPAIASLYEGVRIVKENLDTYSNLLEQNTQKIINGLKEISGVQCYSTANRSGIVAFETKTLPSEDFASALNFEYDIAVRGGFHCAPLTHKFLGTAENGLVRVSLSVQNSTREIYYFLNAVKSLCQN